MGNLHGSLMLMILTQVAVGKVRTVCVTVEGSVFMWDNSVNKPTLLDMCQKQRYQRPGSLGREKIQQVAVGERHSNILCMGVGSSLYSQGLVDPDDDDDVYVRFYHDQDGISTHGSAQPVRVIGPWTYH